MNEKSRRAKGMMYRTSNKSTGVNGAKLAE